LNCSKNKPIPLINYFVDSTIIERCRYLKNNVSDYVTFHSNKLCYEITILWQAFKEQILVESSILQRKYFLIVNENFTFRNTRLFSLSNQTLLKHLFIFSGSLNKESDWKHYLLTNSIFNSFTLFSSNWQTVIVFLFFASRKAIWVYSPNSMSNWYNFYWKSIH